MRLLLLSGSLLLAGCGAKSGDSYFPLTEGSQWVYRVVTESDGNTVRDTQTISVLRESSYDGKPLFIRRSETPSNIGIEYWLRADANGITRIAQRVDLQELAVIDPEPRTVLKLPLALGASWSASTVPYTIYRKNEYPREIKYARTAVMTYSVEALDEKLSVPAGNFDHCARIVGRADVTLFTDPVKGFNKVPLTTTEWYCRGVGLVKVERVEELKTGFYSGGKVVMELVEFGVR